MIEKIENYNVDDEINKVEFPFRTLLNIMFIISALFYVGYHLYVGNYGFKNYINKQEIINQKYIKSKKIENEISGIQNKINRLQDDNLDSDLLDEEIRKNTSYAKKNEIIIYSKEL